MKKLTKALALAGLVSTFGMSGAASAVTIDGISFDGGVTLQIGTIYEGETASGFTAPITAIGQVLGGIGIVDAIKNGGGATVWSNGTNGRELTFEFGGYVAEKITFLPGGIISILFSGGHANFFSDAAGNFSPSLGTTALDVATAINGTPWLNLTGGSTGVICAVVDACFSGAGTAITLQSTILIGSLSAIGSGVGNGFLNVAAGAGAANSHFDTNTQAGGNDTTLGSSFNSAGATGDFFASGSFDLRGATIPEPESLALFGIGLLGLAAGSLRRRSNKN